MRSLKEIFVAFTFFSVLKDVGDVIGFLLRKCPGALATPADLVKFLNIFIEGDLSGSDGVLGGFNVVNILVVIFGLGRVAFLLGRVL